MASDIWLRTILIVRKETRWRHIGYSYRLTARVLLYAPSHRQDSTYHGLCYTSRGALAGMRNSSMGPPHEGSIWRPIAPWANALTSELRPAPRKRKNAHVGDQDQGLPRSFPWPPPVQPVTKADTPKKKRFVNVQPSPGLPREESRVAVPQGTQWEWEVVIRRVKKPKLLMNITPELTQLTTLPVQPLLNYTITIFTPSDFFN